MAWRGLHLSRPAQLSYAAGALKLRLLEEGTEALRLPLEDLGWIILDGGQATLSARLLAECGKADVAVLVSDERHLPAALLLPAAGYHRRLESLKLQLAATVARRARLWRALIEAKLTNQAEVLALVAPSEAGRARALLAMARRLKAGDPENLEARGAQDYWRGLLPDFVRSDGSDPRNGYLDYGYAIVRAILARELAAQGFEPALGVKHAGLLNPFNLADDLLEPFRPLVDLFALAVMGEAAGDSAERLTSEAVPPLGLAARRRLAALPGRSLLLEGQVMSHLAAARRLVASLRGAFAESRAKLLLPAPAPPGTPEEAPPEAEPGPDDGEG